jgi:hypothetical protein
MRRWEAWTNHVGIALVGGSGVVYGLMKYVLSGSEPDSRLGHPMQPAVAKLHILAAPIAVFGLGLLFRRHALARLFGGEVEGRRSGSLMTWLFVPLCFSGYLVQAITGEAARRWTGWTHAAVGLLFAAAYAFHPRRSRLPDDSAKTSADAERDVA